MCPVSVIDEEFDEIAFKRAVKTLYVNQKRLKTNFEREIQNQQQIGSWIRLI